MVEKVGFTNCVFVKLCFQFKNKNCMLKKNRKFMKNSGLFSNMAKWCFWGLFFVGFNIKKVFFGVSGIVSKVLKMLVFPILGFFFLGWLIVVRLGLEGLGVFVFLVFVFLFCLAFVSVLFALFLALWLDVVVLFFWCFSCCFCCFVFLFFLP